MLALAIALPSKLRVAPAETEHMPIYLRTFFRVLSSWVHPIYLRKRPPGPIEEVVVGATLGPQEPRRGNQSRFGRLSRNSLMGSWFSKNAFTAR